MLKKNLLVYDIITGTPLDLSRDNRGRKGLRPDAESKHSLETLR